MEKRDTDWLGIMLAVGIVIWTLSNVLTVINAVIVWFK